MKINKIVNIINGEILCSAHLAEDEIYSAYASDMMSDVLAYVSEQELLITGLANPQIVRTAVMLDMNCIVLVRGKVPDAMTLELATKNNIVFISTDLGMFKTAGVLFNEGVKA